MPIQTPYSRGVPVTQERPEPGIAGMQGRCPAETRTPRSPMRSARSWTSAAGTGSTAPGTLARIASTPSTALDISVRIDRARELLGHKVPLVRLSLAKPVGMASRFANCGTRHCCATTRGSRGNCRTSSSSDIIGSLWIGHSRLLSMTKITISAGCRRETPTTRAFRSFRRSSAESVITTGMHAS